MDKYLYFNMVTHRVHEWEELTDMQKLSFENSKNFGYGVAYEDEYIKSASLQAEFSQVINVSFGYENSTDSTWRGASVTSLNEKELLQKVSGVIDAFAACEYSFAGYNVTYYDIPYLTKRFIINGIRVPDALKRYDKKYWEIKDFNLKQTWKFNGGQDTPLEVICSCLGIDIEDELSIYEIFKKSISEVDLTQVSKLSEKRNQLVHAVHKKIIELI